MLNFPDGRFSAAKSITFTVSKVRFKTGADGLTPVYINRRVWIAGRIDCGAAAGLGTVTGVVAVIGAMTGAVAGIGAVNGAEIGWGVETGAGMGTGTDNGIGGLTGMVTGVGTVGGGTGGSTGLGVLPEIMVKLMERVGPGIPEEYAVAVTSCTP